MMYLHFVKNNQNKDIFEKKPQPPNSFLSDTNLVELNLERAWTFNFKSLAIFNIFPEKYWGLTFQMRYWEARWRQYCPNGGPLLSLGGGDTENCKKVHFLLLSLLLENFVKKNSTRIGPCESSRPELSENV